MKKYKLTEYGKKLRDPQWQKKRLEIMQRDDFTCKSCFDTESTLNVHHAFYEKGRDPWDYPNQSLVTLCETCHEEETQLLYQEKQLLLKALSEKGLFARHFNELAVAFYRSNLSNWDPIISAVAWAIETPEMISKINDLYSEHISKRAAQ